MNNRTFQKMGKRSGHLSKDDKQKENKIYRQKKYTNEKMLNMSLGNCQLKQQMRYQYKVISGQNLKH